MRARGRGILAHVARTRSRVLPALLLTGALVVGSSPAAAAPEPAPSPERIRSAAEEFDRGRRAFLAKDFEQAAVHFENAYRDAPRAEALRLAIRARREAKQLARAATHAALAQERYPEDAATTQLAREVLAEAGPSLHELLVECAPECSVAEGGRVLSAADAPKHRIFLDPGAHVVGIGFRSGSVTQNIEAKRGGRDVVTATPPVEPPPPPPPPPKDPAPAKVAPAGGNKPLGPLVFFVAAGVTLVAAGATVVSGIDTQNSPGADAVRRECAGKDETCALYQEGQRSELRTNVLLGVTAGAAVGTAVVGLFFTRWSSPTATLRPSLTVGAGGAGAGLQGAF